MIQTSRTVITRAETVTSEVPLDNASKRRRFSSRLQGTR